MMTAWWVKIQTPLTAVRLTQRLCEELADPKRHIRPVLPARRAVVELAGRRAAEGLLGVAFADAGPRGSDPVEGTEVALTQALVGHGLDPQTLHREGCGAGGRAARRGGAPPPAINGRRGRRGDGRPRVPGARHWTRAACPRLGWPARAAPVPGAGLRRRRRCPHSARAGPAPARHMSGGSAVFVALLSSGAWSAYPSGTVLGAARPTGSPEAFVRGGAVSQAGRRGHRCAHLELGPTPGQVYVARSSSPNA